MVTCWSLAMRLMQHLSNLATGRGMSLEVELYELSWSLVQGTIRTSDSIYLASTSVAQQRIIPPCRHPPIHRSTHRRRSVVSRRWLHPALLRSRQAVLWKGWGELIRG